MLFIQAQQANLKVLINQLIHPKKYHNFQQQIQISYLEPVIDHFYRLYFQHLPKSVLLNKVNDFFCKLLNKTISVDLLADIYKQLSLHIRKFNRYHEYLKQIDEIIQEQNQQQCEQNKQFHDQIQDRIDLPELNEFNKKTNHNEKESEQKAYVQYEVTTLTLEQDIQNLPEFNFYEPVANIQQGQILEQWTDQFIEKKMHEYTISQKQNIEKHSPKQSSSTSGTRMSNQLTFNKQLQVVIPSGQVQKKAQISQNLPPSLFISENNDENNISKSYCFSNNSKNQFQYNSIKDQVITQWSLKMSHIFVEQNPNKVNELIKQQQQAEMVRAKKMQDQQQCQTINAQSYYKFLRRLKQRAKMKIYSKNYKK